MKRECGTCTKCCEGYLAGEALGKVFDLGKPCHYVSIGKGCTVYTKRPTNPCVSFKCQWLENTDLPEWLKPDAINAIVKVDKVKDIFYLRVVEAGEMLQSKVLSWLIQYAVNNQLNFVWQINGGSSWIGSPEFHQAMNDFPNNKYLHLEPNRLLPVVEIDKKRP